MDRLNTDQWVLQGRRIFESEVQRQFEDRFGGGDGQAYFIGHYTSESAAASIVDKQRLKLNHLRFQRDEEEHASAFQIVLDQLRIQTDLADEKYNQLLIYTLSNLGPLKSADAFVLSCFAAKVERESRDYIDLFDNLSFWESYAKSSSGVCLVFDFQHLQQCFLRAGLYNLAFGHVIYDADRFAAFVQEQISSTLNNYEGELADGSAALTGNSEWYHANALANSLNTACFFFKRPHFKTESEYRFVVLSADPVLIDTGDAETHIPHLWLPINCRKEEASCSDWRERIRPLPILCTIMGPVADPRGAKSEIFSLKLKRAGYISDVLQIRTSKLRLRGAG